MAPLIGHAELKVDGRLNETEWSQAQIFQNFKVVQPLTYNTPQWKTEARLLSLPEGLAVAFVCEQPEEARTRTISRRDADRFDADAVSLIIDAISTPPARVSAIHRPAWRFSAFHRIWRRRKSGAIPAESFMYGHTPRS
jgi:hypothetical protein